MAPIGMLHGHPMQQQTKAILGAAAVADLEIESMVFEFGKTNRSAEWLAKFPFAKIPAFEAADGFILIEGAPIARYMSSLVPESGLAGHDVKEAALIDQWVHLAEYEVALPANAIFAGTVHNYIAGFNDQLFKFYKERVDRALKFFDEFLAKRESGWLVGDRLTLADIFVATATQRAGVTVCGAHEREKLYPHAFAHFAKVASHAKLSHLFKEPVFIESAVTFKAE